MHIRDKFSYDDNHLAEKLSDYLNYKFVFNGYDDFSDVRFQRFDNTLTYKTGEDFNYVYTKTVNLPHHFRFAGRPHSTLTDSQRAEVKKWYKTKYRSIGRKKMIRDRKMFDVRKFLLSLFTGFFGFVFLFATIVASNGDKNFILAGLVVTLPFLLISIPLFVYVIYKCVLAKKLRNDIAFQKKLDDVIASAPESVVRCYFRPDGGIDIKNMQGDRFSNDSFEN